MISATRRYFLGGASMAAIIPTRGHALQEDRGAIAKQPTARPGICTGGSRSVSIDGGYAVWVKRVGSGPMQVLTLHGGPGFNHFYLECFEDFLPAAGITYWYYDQLGCGFSDSPKDVHLWTIERYCAEVEQVRSALGLKRFVLYGHSWGAMLGIEYALRYPQYLSGLVISNMADSVRECVEYAATLFARLPSDVQRTLETYRHRRQFDAPEYQKILLQEVYRRHFCRLDSWPEPVQRTLRTMNASIYNTMSGPDEFDVTGNLKNWDVRARLPELRMPTLLMAARYDEMPPARIRKMAELIPHARAMECSRGSHLAMYDDQQTYFDALIAFLRSI